MMIVEGRTKAPKDTHILSLEPMNISRYRAREIMELWQELQIELRLQIS